VTRQFLRSREWCIPGLCVAYSRIFASYRKSGTRSIPRSIPKSVQLV